MAIRWIHVITLSKLPIARAGQSSVYESYEDGFDPNVDTPFGSDKESMFLQIQSPAIPTVNRVLEKVDKVTTIGADGKEYHGQYTDPNWVEDWIVSEQDLDKSKEYKIEEAITAYDVHVTDGYIVGAFIFPFTESFFQMLGERLGWMEQAIDAGVISATRTLTFSDLADKEVTVGVTQLKTNYIEFGKEYLGGGEVLVSAKDSINAATTPAMVDAVTWDYSVL